MAWQKGPLPPATWCWGGVVPVGVEGGFHFADFCGDHAVTCPGGERVEARDVAWYDNSLMPAPPGAGRFVLAGPGQPDAPSWIVDTLVPAVRRP